MDVFGAVVSVIDLLEKSKKAYDKFQDAKNLPKAFGTIAGQIALATSIFEDVRKCTQSQLEAEKIKGTIEQCEEDAKALKEIYELVREHIDSDWLHRYKTYISTMKENRKGEVEKIWNRILNGSHLLADYFNIQKLSEIRAAIDEISKLPSSLQDSGSGDTWNAYGDVGVMGANYAPVTFNKAARDFVNNNYNEDPNKAYKECLSALCITDPREHLKKALERGRDGRTAIDRGAGTLETCKWIDIDEQFLGWQQSLAPALLCVIGEAGIGKTMLTTQLIKRILPKRMPANNAKLVYFFCNNNTEDSRRNNAGAILRGLLWFLLNDNPNLFPAHFTREWAAKGSDFFRSSEAEDTLWDIFSGVVTTWNTGQLWIVIDAFDECEARSRKWLCNKFYDLLERPELVHLKVMMTSRSIDDTEDLSAKCEWAANYKIAMTAGEVKEDVDDFIETEVGRISKQKQWNERTVTEVKEQLKSRAGGTFLWVSLVLKSLAEVESFHVPEMLAGFPEDLNEVYRRILREIPDRNQFFASRVLHLVLSAEKAMSFDVLALALYFDIEPRKTLPGPADVETCRQRIETCKMLLRLDNGRMTKEVTIIHQSVKDFVTATDSKKVDAQWHYTLDEPATKARLSNICVRYLQTKEFVDVSKDATRLYNALRPYSEIGGTVQPDLPLEFESLPSWAALAKTVALYSHFSSSLFDIMCGKALARRSFRFYSFSIHLKDFLEAIHAHRAPLATLNGHIYWELAALALFRGHKDILEVMCTLCEDRPDSHWDSHCDEQTLRLLRVSVFSGNSKGSAILAAYNRGRKTYDARMTHSSALWKNVSKMNKRIPWFGDECKTRWLDEREWLPDWQVNMPGTGDMAHKLAAFDALVLGYSGVDTPLHVVARQGDLPTLRLILLDGKECRKPNFLRLENHEGETPLHAAINSNRRECAEFLYDLEDRVNQDNKDPLLTNRRNRLPLHYAACFESSAAVKALIEADTEKKSMFSRDPDGMLPLHLAAEFGSVEVIKALINADPRRMSLSTANNHGMLPLHCAVRRSQIGHAAQNEAKECVKALLKADSQGKSLYTKDHMGKLPLHYATSIDPYAGWLEVSREYLLGTNFPDIQPAVQAAVSDRSSPTVVQLLLQADLVKASPYVKDSDGNIPLHLALCAMGSFRGSPIADGTVRALLEADETKQSLTMEDKDGNIAIHLAIQDLRRPQNKTYGGLSREELYEAIRPIERPRFLIIQSNRFNRFTNVYPIPYPRDLVRFDLHDMCSLQMIKAILDMDSSDSMLNARDCNDFTPLDHVHRELSLAEGLHREDMEAVREYLCSRGGIAKTGYRDWYRGEQKLEDGNLTALARVGRAAWAMLFS